MVLSTKLLQSGIQMLGMTGRLAIRSNIRVNSYRLISASSARLAERRYTDKHEWVIVNGDVGIIGITNYAQEALGDVVFAQLPDIGKMLKAKDECGALESVKAASELYSPVSGEVLEKNVEVEDSPSLINTNCFDKGWLFKVKLSDLKEIDELMDEKKYEEYLKTDCH